MAELNCFGYHYGQTMVHRLDVRCKLACLILLTSAVMSASMAVTASLTIGMMLLWIILRLPVHLLRRELLAFFFFLLLVFAARALSVPGEPWIIWGGLRISREGVLEGGIVVWRLLMILVLGLVFITTTRPADMKAAVQWLLRPIPFLPERKAAMMVGLMVRFIPFLHLQIRETQEALDARAGGQRKRTLKKIKDLVLPSMRRVVLSADQLALAMSARCYSDDRTDPVFTAGPADGLALAISCAVLGAALII